MLELSELLKSVEDKKRDSRYHRDEGDRFKFAGLLKKAKKEYQLAEQPLVEAIGLLRPALIPIEAQLNAREGTPTPLSDDELKVVEQLADCLGSLGGVHRRTKSNRDAAAAYEEGSTIHRKFGVVNSYNLVQSFVARILDDSDNLKDASFQRRLADAIRADPALKSADQRSDPWALADLGLVNLLLDNKKDADDAWDRIDLILKVSPRVYSSTALVLADLLEVLPSNENLRAALTRFKTKAGT